MAGLYYLHSQGILNCDLKPANILVDEYGVLKLADFGMSRSIPDSMESIQQIVHGSPHYMSPELLDQVAVHSYQSDLWAFVRILSRASPLYSLMVFYFYHRDVYCMNFEQENLPSLI